MTRPGESTSAHRHRASALRFIMEGSKGYTVVDGNKIMLEVNDFVITPNSTWHEHGVENDGENMYLARWIRYSTCKCFRS